MFFIIKTIVKGRGSALRPLFSILESEEEVINDKEDNADNDAKDAGNANDDTTGNEDTATMPPKVKPMAAQKPTAKKPTGMSEDNIIHTPAAKPLAISTNFSIKATDPLAVAHYADGTHDFKDVAIQVNGTMNKG
jgi:hypothetical protein